MKKTQFSSQESGVRATILVVEDNPMNRKLIRRLLEIHRFQVIEAEDAETGIQMAIDRHPDLILMDIQLPKMDGLEATKIIKSNPTTAEINVIALTSYAMQGDSEKARSAGCDSYITKPINTRQFVEEIGCYLSKKTPPDIRARSGGNDRPKILIVDDEPMSLKLLTSKLKKEYTNIISVSNGYDALQLAAEEVPDIVLLDIMMPGINGIEVTRQLKAASKTKHIPIILITVLDGHDYKVLGHEAGADEFLNKPINTVELLTRMKSLLDMKKCQDKLVANASKASGDDGLDLVDNLLDLQDGKILILMADSEHCKTIQLYLFKQMYDISIANDLKNAIDSMHQYAPDILIIDDQLNEGGFLTFCQGIKADQRTGNCQILYTAPEQDLALNIGPIDPCVDDFITLPINVHELRARIGVLLKKKAFQDRLSEGGSNNVQSIITDQLTGLYNFEYCKHALKHELCRSEREHSTVAFVIMEVSERLASNGSVGHFAGDPLFKELSELIQRSIRKLDIASRRSKRTYAFVLPEADREKTVSFIHRMKTLAASQLNAVKSSGDAVDDLLHFGFAICPDDSDKLDALIEMAEANLVGTSLRTSDESLESAEC